MNWLDITVLIICVASVLGGLKTGLIMQVASLLGIILGVLFASTVAQWIAPYTDGVFGNVPETKGIVTYIVAFLLILIVVNLIGAIVNFVVKIVLLDLVNRIGGAVFGLISSVLIISVVLTILVQFDRNQLIIKKEVREKSHIYPILLKIAEPIIPLLHLDKFTIPPFPTKGNQQLQEVSV